MASGASKTARRLPFSHITRRILAVNVLALLVLVIGLLYLGQYRSELISAEITSLRTQAELFAAAIGEGATATDAGTGETLVEPIAKQMVRRLVEASGTRARLFGEDGSLIVDSRLLAGPGGIVQIQELPAPQEREGQPVKSMLDLYDQIVERFSKRDALPQYVENPDQTASDYVEVLTALTGTSAAMVRAEADGELVIGVAMPVTRYKQVLGALMLTKGSRDIDAAVFEVRMQILKIFAIALAITVLMSLYLAGTIARPILKLAAAAQTVRRDRHRKHRIPDFSGRSDEIGQLAAALREMTEALWLRMDAIERFAADVAHEIKNPLTSLRSAVETAARVNDHDRRERLMTIIQDDVQRLDRLISDISDASRLDAELTRELTRPVSIGDMLHTIVDVTRTSGLRKDVKLRLHLNGSKRLAVVGLEERLVQVFRNLIANAISFSPPGGTITLKATQINSSVVAEVLDDGPGVPEGKEKEIFNRFYSERPKDEKFGMHSGLGLSISQQIIQAHGGSIVAENRRHRDGRVAGARFIVTLPTS